MDKVAYLKLYRHPKITIWFNDEVFMRDANIILSEETISSREFRNFFVLRPKKGGVLDQRGIEERICDPGSTLITVNEAAGEPPDWDLALGERILPKIDDLSNIPIATDTLIRKTLVLDSNHCITNMLNQNTKDFMIPVVRLSGGDLKHIIIDFNILSRQK